MSTKFNIIFLYELVKIIVEESNQSKKMNPQPPSPRPKAPSAKRDRRTGDENDVVQVTSLFPTLTVA